MEDLIRGSAPTAFREKGFWDEFYQRRGDAAFEWYGTWPDVARLVLRHADPALPALVLGCGNSTLSQDMRYAGGFASVTSIDFSEEVVAAMRSKTQAMDGLHWAVMDMTRLQYDNESFGCVMDKGALDALYAADEDAIAEDVSRMFREVQRVLRPGGSYLCITMAQDYVLQRLLQHFAGPGWGVDLHTFAPSDGTAAPAFLVALTKGGTGLRVDDGMRAAESDAPDGDVDVASALHIVAEYQERRYRALTAAAGALEVRHDAQDFAAATQQRRDDDDDEADGLHLSAATLAALADFAVERGILQADQVNAQTLLMDVTRGCDVADREDQWAYRFGDIDIELRGVKRELGQTLSSTGLTLWAAADQLAAFLHAHREVVADKAVVDLGCGLGLVGILAARCGACRVVLTDGAADALALLADNLRRNPTDPAEVASAALDWTDCVARTRLLDQYGPFDVVLGADVCYSEAAVGPLFHTAAALLKPAGTFLLAYTQRGVFPDVVLGAAQAAGFVWRVVDGDGAPNGIYSMTLSTSDL
eukprot:EG_transcript_8804